MSVKELKKLSKAFGMDSLYLLCLLFVCVQSVQSQNIYGIENSLNNFVHDEEHLWKTINHSDIKKTRVEDVRKVLEFYEVYTNLSVGEIGIFQMISKDWLNTFSTSELMKQFAKINNTYTHAFELIKNNSYDDILQFAKGLKQIDITFYTVYLLEHVDNFWSKIRDTSRICDNDTHYILSETQVVREVYKEFLAHFLKAYIIIQFKNAIEATSVEEVGYIFSMEERGSFNQDIVKFKNSLYDYDKYINDRVLDREMWACDANEFKFNDRESYIELAMPYQGFISNEMNLNKNRNCRQSCSDFTNTRQFVCDAGSYCRENEFVGRELLCHGSVKNCVTMQDDMTVCVAPSNSSRRYDFIKYDNGNVIGAETDCRRKIRLISHWDWFYKCENCLCYCEDEGISSNAGRHFSLRDVTSDIEQNLIVTGVGITKVNHVIQLTISQRKLLPNGVLNTTNDQKSLVWITSPALDITDDQRLIENMDYVSVTMENRSIALISAKIDDDQHVVTGVRFRRYDGHIGIEIRATRFDFEKGNLLDLEDSWWIRNTNTLSELKLNRPDVPTKTLGKSEKFAENNEFIKLQPSDLEKDAAQTTVPYLDVATVEAVVPLSGIGLYYKSTSGYGGFIAPKLITYDFGPVRNKRAYVRW